jgi:glycerophosphoryl diester phosphodiesterase
MNYKLRNYLLLLLVLLLFAQCDQKQNKSKTSSTSETELQQFFKYTGDSSIIISGHRGNWRNSSYPDNSLEGLIYVTEHVPDVFFEIDPRLTKDSVIVLMHDATLERTTDGQGKLNEYTWEELQDIRLKDSEGNITQYRIPTLEEVIRWSIGKTVLDLDRKDVPPSMIVELIKKCEAEHAIMLTVHTGEQARFYYDQLPNVMLSARIRDENEFDDFANSGVPWDNMIAYIGQTINEENRELVDKLHNLGLRCMIALSPTHDRLETAEERAEAYREEISRGPDIIETDYPVEVWKVLNDMRE